MATRRSSPIFVEIGHGLSIMSGLPSLTSWDSDSRPKNPKLGTFGFNTDTTSLEYWDGSKWLAAKMS